MRILALVPLMMLVLSGAADAKAHHHGAYYTNSSGHRVHRPVTAARAPRGATAQCGDHTYSFSEHHQGTCSHHGGVARWL
jgi:hypothetical protein